MASANNRVSIVELDFDQIKSNMVTFMQGQSIFSDYNFEGSGLNVLLDILSYNTHYGAIYVNMLANEMHISTAQVRDNIVRLAKSLNYVPRSTIAPAAGINIVITPPNTANVASTLVLPRFTTFISQAVNSTNYNFATTTSYSAPFNGTSFIFNNVLIYEGDVVNYTYPVVGNDRVSFNIPNANIDASTLIVNVNETENTQPYFAPYNLSQDVSLLNGESRVYFLEGAENSTYNIYFGDNILGKKPSNGDSVNLVYLNTHGPASNFANNFSITKSVGGYTNAVVSPVSPASGGALAESNADIRFRAPLSYSTQNRAVTIQDYSFLLSRDYSNIGSVAVWGGDKNTPPIYSKIFISIKPKFGNYLSNLEKQRVINLLNQYNMPTVEPVIIDPDYTYMLFNIDVSYNPNLTTTPSDQLAATIRNVLINYTNTNLSKFDKTYRESSLSQIIIDSDPSILGTDIEVFLQKRFFPVLTQKASYTLNFNTSILRGGLDEKLYSSPGVYIFDSSGILRNCFIEENINTYQGITQINIITPGFSYTDTPSITITGDGIGAVAHAVIVNGALNSVVLDNPGEGYSFATATVTGGGGYGASVTPVLTSSTGILQTYYIDSSNKFFVSTNQGTVDHINGIVTLNNFTPIDVSNQTKVFSINVKPDKNYIVPLKNNILILDPTDPASIQINMVSQIT